MNRGDRVEEVARFVMKLRKIAQLKDEIDVKLGEVVLDDTLSCEQKLKKIGNLVLYSIDTGEKILSD